MSAIIHIVPGLAEPWNGIAVAAKLFASEQNAKLVDIRHANLAVIRDADEVWVHSCWTPWVWRACRFAIAERKRLVRMLHGNLDPLRLSYHGWKKWLVGPIERFYLRRADYIVATCEAEKDWVQSYLDKRCPQIGVTDIKRFFDLPNLEVDALPNDRPLHLLYLGRNHPLKGLVYLEGVGKGIEGVELRVVSNAFGDEKEKVWDWCDVLVLPTLSENFGLVVAEALERGKRVITTDGAPAWGDGNDYGGRLVYLKGYRDGSDEDRVRLLKGALTSLVG